MIIQDSVSLFLLISCNTLQYPVLPSCISAGIGQVGKQDNRTQRWILAAKNSCFDYFYRMFRQNFRMFESHQLGFIESQETSFISFPNALLLRKIKMTMILFLNYLQAEIILKMYQALHRLTKIFLHQFLSILK